MKKIILGLILAISLFLNINILYANEINNIDMDIYIDESGNIEVTEVWDANLTEGTEGYKTFSNLGNSVISEFEVSDGINNYTYISNWNTEDSFENKKYKNGINYTDDGVELCFGISEYGNRKYTLKYKITNFVNLYTDTDGIYFKLLDLDQDVMNVTIKIHSDIYFSLDNARIWPLGFNGSGVFKEGNIILKSNGTLPKEDYMTLLVRFNENLFNTESKINKSFDEEYNEVFNINKEEKQEKLEEHIIIEKGSDTKKILLFILTNPILWVVVFALFIKSIISKKRKSKKETNHSLTDNKLVNSIDEINYYRNIPCEGNLTRAYWIILHYQILSKQELKKNIVEAILLKWIKENKISFIKNENNNDYVIDFTKFVVPNNEIEKELYYLFLSACDKDKILIKEEFKYWCKNNYHRINNWYSNIYFKEELNLINEGLIKINKEKANNILGNRKNLTLRKVNTKLESEGKDLLGLKRFLLDFSLINEKSNIEVVLWEDYLIFASLLGIAYKVKEEFGKINEEFNKQYDFELDSVLITIEEISKYCYESSEMILKTSSRSSSSGSHDYSGTSTKSGSGGSSSRGYSGGGFR